jgi:hypothetical protein
MPNKLFDNPNQLTKAVILFRLQADPLAEVTCYTSTNADTMKFIYYVTVDSALTDQEITTVLSTAVTVAETAQLQKLADSMNHARAIPSWATWTETEALTWGATNIGTPLTSGRSALPATLTLATARSAIIAILNILDKMWVMQVSLARLVIALRDKAWPNL